MKIGSERSPVVSCSKTTGVFDWRSTRTAVEAHLQHVSKLLPWRHLDDARSARLHQVSECALNEQLMEP